MRIAMIFAAGRGERMRPLTDHTPKPLLTIAGTPLIVWQIEALARAGIAHIVINHAWLGDKIETALGDGRQWGVRIHYSREGENALETAGGIANALPLFARARAIDAAESSSDESTDGSSSAATIFLAVSGDIFSRFDYRTLLPRARELAAAAQPGMHLVMVPNPPYHADGDFSLPPGNGGRLALEGEPRLTFGNIGVYDTRLFASLAARQPIGRAPLGPLIRDAIRGGAATGERWDGVWANVGTPAELAALQDTRPTGR